MTRTTTVVSSRFPSARTTGDTLFRSGDALAQPYDPYGVDRERPDG